MAEMKESKLTYEDIFSHPDPMKCECLHWAGIWDKEELKRKKKHHPQCKHAKSTKHPE